MRKARVWPLAATVALLTGGLVSAAVAEEPERRKGYGVGRVSVDVGGLPSPDCWFEVGLSDVDGRPGGVKRSRVVVRCP